MLPLGRYIIFLCAGRAKMFKVLLTKHYFRSEFERCIACSSQTYKNKRIPSSSLFTPAPIKPHNNPCNSGEELTGKLNQSKLVKAINAFYRKPELRALAEEHNLDDYLLQKGFISFRKYCLNSSTLPTDLHIALFDIIQLERNEIGIFPFFLKHVREIFPHLECMEDLKKIGDLTSPANGYPETRNIKRKVIFHCGPTNSGKTYHAIDSFYKAKCGVYCGPLKLLAVEIFNKSTEKGIQCDLVTGEEVIHTRPDGEPASHISCTVEMCSLEKTYDVAIIDEIQMIKDPQRGWAWTRALLGLRAKEIHLCGEEAAVDLVDSILCTTNEDLEVKKYERLTKLHIDKPLKSFSNVRPGDCIVCFSKRDIFYVTEALESHGKEVAVIYGSLPPGTKLAQCQKFNDPGNTCNTLVATDAIGMGLNLAVKRIIFYSMVKPVRNEDGNIEKITIPVSQALQIAGRAGRYGSRFNEGYVTTFNEKDLPILEHLLSQTPEPVMSAGLLPTVDQIELFSFYLPYSTLSNLMDIFIHLSTVDDSMYFICDIKDFKFLAEMIEHIPLPLRVKYVFCSAPINKTLQFTCSIFLKFAKMFSENKVITFEYLSKNINWPVSPPKTIKELLHLEAIHESLDLYQWLSYRFPDYFPDKDMIKDIQNELDLIIQKGILDIISLLRIWDKNISNERQESKKVKGLNSRLSLFEESSSNRKVTSELN